MFDNEFVCGGGAVADACLKVNTVETYVARGACVRANTFANAFGLVLAWFWFGLVWFGLVWFGLVRSGLARHKPNQIQMY